MSKETHWKTIIRCQVSVYSKAMYIYMITCIVNGKRYIGRTARSDPRRRWREHCSTARRGDGYGIIPRAIRKYGKDAFRFEVIEKVESLGDLPERETHWINYYQTLSPKGYNLEMYQPNRVLSEESQNKLSTSLQGQKKRGSTTSRFVGVYRRGSRWVAMLTYRRIYYSLAFDTEIEASVAYDKLALYLVGPKAKTNHLNAKYSPEELKHTYSEFVSPRLESSLYKDVHYSATIGKWKGVLKFGRTSRVRICDTEIEAAQFVDVVRVICLGAAPEQLNFPERYSQYRTLDEAWLKRRARIPLSKGVTKRGNRYLVRLGNGGSLWHGSFESKQEAQLALSAKRKELGMTWDL